MNFKDIIKNYRFNSKIEIDVCPIIQNDKKSILGILRLEDNEWLFFEEIKGP